MTYTSLAKYYYTNREEYNSICNKRFTSDNKLSTLNRYEEVIGQMAEKDIDKSLAFVLIQGTLFSKVGINKKELCDFLDISTNTLDKKIKVLKKYEYVITQTSGRTLFYSFDINKLM